ncbi:MAG: beta-N-acetylhexosaminidase [Bacteroidota bacterium]
MKKISLFVFVVMTSIFLNVSCTEQEPTDLTKTAFIHLTKTAFIPKPEVVEAEGGAFVIKNSTVIYVQEGLESIGNYLSAAIEHIAGFEPKVITTGKDAGKGIFIAIDGSVTEKEGYVLDIDKKEIEISGADAAGCFYAVQTLLQTLPIKAAAEEKLIIPTGRIEDHPDYGFRGAMLDMARHFFEVEEVKRFIDYLAAYKMNVLHLHLSDDQGWRIEIKSWPKLTEIGGSTEVGGGKGGYYTQEQYADIVAYAAERQITIIPEIDMPGHTNAALASYAELNCEGKATGLYTGTKTGFSTLCTNKEVVYEFLDDVIGELAAITPGPYIHIGGDESRVTAMEDYIPFINRVQQIVVKHGKTVIGWDAIAHATPVKDAVVQFYSIEENAVMGIEKGAKVIMSPAKKAYLDMQYNSTSQYGLHWAGYIETDTGYDWDPASVAEGIKREHIVGIEAPLWSETVSNIDEAEYLVFPRLPGYAEIGWTAVDARNWDDYKIRLAKHGKRFEDMGIDYYKSPKVQWAE